MSENIIERMIQELESDRDGALVIIEELMCAIRKKQAAVAQLEIDIKYLKSKRDQ